MVKRVFDLLVSFFLIIILLPFMLIVALLIKLESKGPAIFKQSRVGLGGKEFIIYKFRSMHFKGQNEFGLSPKDPEDSRLTRIGLLLRRTSIDEIPQLINVVKGDMSLVGPRPLSPEEINLRLDALDSMNIEDFQIKRNILINLRHTVRPGITGLKQVSGRSNLSVLEAINLDKEYLERQSLLLDLQILLKTIFEVINQRGVN